MPMPSLFYEVSREILFISSGDEAPLDLQLSIMRINF